MTVKKLSQFLSLLAVLSLVSCSSTSRSVFIKTVTETPAKRLESYRFDPKSSLISRVQTAPDFLIAYLKKIDKKESYSPYMPTRDEMAMIEDYLAKLPPLHMHVLQERLVGIYFVTDFWGSGMADYVLGQNNEIYTIIILNPETMRHDMTAWMSYRESTIYRKDDDSIRIVVDCGTVYTGLMYALLHETTHVVDYIKNYTPYVDRDTRIIRGTSSETQFVKNVWSHFEKPEPRYDFSDRSNITVYGFRNGPHISLKDAFHLYETLSRLPFTSLYSLTEWPEDFADYVTWFHFTKNLNQPYTITVYDQDKIIIKLAPFESEAVRHRARAVQNLFVNPAESRDLHPPLLPGVMRRSPREVAL